MTDARRYLLGSLTDDQRAAIESDYFAVEDSRLTIEAAEEQLIEEYLAGDLNAAERQQFERYYLASPIHRRRVEVVKSLMATTPPQRAFSYRWLAVAAALIIVTGAVRLLAPRPLPPPPGMVSVPGVTTGGDKPLPATPRPQSVFAFALSPASVRSARPSTPLVIPPATDVVMLELQQEGRAPQITDPIAVVRTVDGTEVWKGAATLDGLRPGILARVEVPAAQLRPNDYFVEVGGYRYFLAVR